jgi:thiol-disulfide isomerase/thioredoxin
VTPSRLSPRCVNLALATFLLLSHIRPVAAQTPSESAPPSKSQKDPSATKPPSPAAELQQSINSAGNDRAALVRNLETFLAKYPDSPQRPQIYRALVEATLQLRDTPRAAGYAERLVALQPEDMSVTLLTIQLLERSGDDAALHRAINYSTRVIDYVNRSNAEEKSPKISFDEWQAEKKRDQISVLALRGRLRFKLKDYLAAKSDFEASYAILPNAAAAEKLAELAELNKDLNAAILQYSRAFALADASSSGVNRREIRQNLGNVWRLAHGSNDGLGEYLLRTYDDLAQNAAPKREKKNANAHEAFEFTLRHAPDRAPFPLASTKGKVLVVSFWATWCGPCRAQEPSFERVVSKYLGNSEVLFLAANCDDDESLVAPYLAEEKMRGTVVFADGLDSLFAINAFPTVVIIDRSGKLAYRSEGFDPDSFELRLAAAVERALHASADSTSIASPAN